MSGAIKAIYGGVKLASGVMVAWPSTNASLPAGIPRATAYDGRFIKQVATSGTNPGGIGGGTTHTHTYGAHSHTFAAHSHTGGATSAFGASLIAAFSSAGTSAAHGGHGHEASYTSATDPASGSTTPGASGAATTEPPYFVVIFGKSDGTLSGIPNGAVAYVNSTTVPTGWRACDGAGGAPDIRNRFLKGAAAGGDGGTTGGTSDSHTHAEGGTHSHTSGGGHAHTVTYAAGAANTFFAGTPTQFSSAGHTHPNNTSSSTDAGALAAATPGASSASDAQPPWYKIYAVQNNSGVASLPIGIICWYDGTLASIPAGWKLCDGTSGTPNLIDKFVKALSVTSELGNTGGATTHTHSGASHAHGGTSHTHTVGATGAASGAQQLLDSDSTAAIYDSQAHTHAAGASTPSGSTTNADNAASSAVNANTSNAPTYTEVAYIQYAG